MLLDDSIEMEYTDYSATADALPLTWDIDLTKIFVPSSLLPNRKKPTNPNEMRSNIALDGKQRSKLPKEKCPCDFRPLFKLSFALNKYWRIPLSLESLHPLVKQNKPFVLHTLEKLDYTQTFSVYIDECLQNHGSQTLYAASPTNSHQKAINNSSNKLQIQQTISSQNAVELDGRLSIGIIKDISPKQPMVGNKLYDSLGDSGEANNSIVRNAALWEKETSDVCSMQDDSNKPSFEDIAGRMAEILSEEEPCKNNLDYHDIASEIQVPMSSIFDNIPPSLKDSLEELYYSDDDENKFDVEEYQPGNLGSEFPEKKQTCSIYTEKSFVQEQVSESLLDDLIGLELSTNTDETACKSFEETDKSLFESQKFAADNVFGQTEQDKLNEMDPVAHTKDSEQELLNCEEKLKDPTEVVLEFPVSYKRPPLQENSSKTKPKKEKKKTKKGKTNIPLKDLFQSEEADRFKVPEFDEFYENLVRQGKCEPRNRETNMDIFPSVNLTGKQQTNVNEFPSLNCTDEPQKTLFYDFAQDFSQRLDNESHPTQKLDNEPCPVSLHETLSDEKKAEPEVEFETLVIDNIPLSVSKENIENVILVYGELKKLTVERHRKFQRAKFQMDFKWKLDWIIDGLNDSQPFGSSNKELVKCYRLTK